MSDATDENMPHHASPSDMYVSACISRQAPAALPPHTPRTRRAHWPGVGASIKAPPECKRPLTSGSTGCLSSRLLALFLTSSSTQHQHALSACLPYCSILRLKEQPKCAQTFQSAVLRAFPPCASHAAASIPRPRRLRSPCTDIWRHLPHLAGHGFWSHRCQGCKGTDLCLPRETRM